MYRYARTAPHFVRHVGFQDPQLFTFKKKLQLLKTLKKTLFTCVLSFFPKLIHGHNYLHVLKKMHKHC